jgi:hypothetical protein
LTPEDCIKMMERAEKVGAYLTSVFQVPVEAVLLNEGETWEDARLRCIEARLRLKERQDAQEHLEKLRTPLREAAQRKAHTRERTGQGRSGRNNRTLPHSMQAAPGSPVVSPFMACWNTQHDAD